MKRLRMKTESAPAFRVRRPEHRGRILPAFAGDAVHLEGERRQIVRKKCESESRSTVCLTHRQLLANDYQLRCHVGPGSGQHVIARVCERHGPEEL